MNSTWTATRRVLVALVALAAAVVGHLGCANSDRVYPPAPTSVAADAAERQPVIVAFGDSLTAGTSVPLPSSYPYLLQKRLDESGYRWRVVKSGVAGETTTDGLSRMQEVLAYRPRIVIVEYGGNDGLQGVAVETVRSNLENMIITFRGGGATVILAKMTLPDNYGGRVVRRFEEIYSGLATKYELRTFSFFEGLKGNSALLPPHGYHPTAEGYRLVAEHAFKVLRPLLAESPTQRDSVF